MVSLSNPTKTPLSLHIFSTMNKSSSMKFKTLIHNLILSHICRVVRALSKAKSIFLEIFKEKNQFIFLKQTHKKNKYRNKILFGSFRLHYNWCSNSSSHVLPFPSPIIEGINIPTSHHIHYDSTWNSIFSTHDDDHDNHDHDHHQYDHKDDKLCNGNNGNYYKEEEGELSSYLQWLEEKGGKNGNLNEGEGNIENEIDRLADMFIANCHEKFRLEKIESYRRYQELLARSM